VARDCTVDGYCEEIRMVATKADFYYTLVLWSVRPIDLWKRSFPLDKASSFEPSFLGKQ
jgi:hypothetical protein